MSFYRYLKKSFSGEYVNATFVERFVESFKDRHSLLTQSGSNTENVFGWSWISKTITLSNITTTKWL